MKKNGEPGDEANDNTNSYNMLLLNNIVPVDLFLNKLILWADLNNSREEIV